jgi:hypothetical protein
MYGGTRMQPSAQPDSPVLPGVAPGMGVRAQVVRGQGGSPVLWWMGVHGGAGESVLEVLFGGTRAAAHCWPLCVSRPPAVVLVARTDARGLTATQAAMREVGERDLAVDLFGLVLMGDSPGRLPRALRDLKEMVIGGVPRCWTLPFVEAWRLGETPTRRNSPREAGQLRDDLRALLSARQEEQ